MKFFFAPCPLRKSSRHIIPLPNTRPSILEGKERYESDNHDQTLGIKCMHTFAQKVIKYPWQALPVHKSANARFDNGKDKHPLIRYSIPALYFSRSSSAESNSILIRIFNFQNKINPNGYEGHDLLIYINDAFSNFPTL